MDDANVGYKSGEGGGTRRKSSSRAEPEKAWWKHMNRRRSKFHARLRDCMRLNFHIADSRRYSDPFRKVKAFFVLKFTQKNLPSANLICWVGRGDHV